MLKDPSLPTSLRASCAEMLGMIANRLRQPDELGEQALPGQDPSAAARHALLQKLQLTSQQQIGAAAAQAIMQNLHAAGDWQLLGSHMRTASLSAVALANE